MTTKAVIILDPGHGGSAAVGGSSFNRASGAHGTLEKDLALDVARRTRDLLRNLADVRLTRDGDQNLSLADRAAQAHAASAAVFVSLHFNGSPDRDQNGARTWIARDACGRSRRLAQSIASRVSQTLGVPNLGTDMRDLGVLLTHRHAPSTAACLAELAYLTNPPLEERLSNGDNRQQLAATLADAIRGFVTVESMEFAATDEFPNTAPHILVGRASGMRVADLVSRGSSLRDKAIQILSAMADLGIRNTPEGRADAYVDVLMWGESNPAVRPSYKKCPKDANGACILSSCGLVVRSVLRLLGLRDQLVDPPYRPGSAIQALITLAEKNHAVINVQRPGDIESAAIEKGDIILMNKGNRQHIFMVKARSGEQIDSIDGGQSTNGDGPCCSIQPRTRKLRAGQLMFDGETRPITRIIKLDKLPFSAEIINLERKAAGQSQSLALVGSGRALVDCPLLASHGPVRPNLAMRWNVDSANTGPVDVAVHLHGFVSVSSSIDLANKESVSGVGFRNVGGLDRPRPCLALIPRGQQTTSKSKDGGSWIVEFPALTASAPGLNNLIDWSLNQFAMSQLGKPAGSVKRGRLIVWAHSGGGARVMSLLANNDPDEIYLMDALYGSSAAAQAWVAQHIARDAASLSTVPESSWQDFMAARGGALRSIYRPGTGTESNNKKLHDAIECSLAAVSNVTMRSFLRKYYRVGGSTLSHEDVPRRYMSQLLVDAAADLTPTTTSLPKPSICLGSHTQGYETDDYDTGYESDDYQAESGAYQSSYDSGAFEEPVVRPCPLQPPRTSSMPLGAAFFASIKGDETPADWAGREEAIYKQLKSGNMPAALWNWKDIPVEFTEKDGTHHTGVFRVMPDFLCIGADSDYAMLPMDAITAQKVADEYCCLLPTAKMVLDIYKQAKKTGQALEALPRPYWKTAPLKQSSTWAYQEHDQAIKAQRKKPLGVLTEGHKKVVVISPRLDQPEGKGKLAFYGFFKANGTPWQGGMDGRASLQHEPTYADYAHGVRLVHPLMKVDNQEDWTVEAVLESSKLCGLLSNEGAFTRTRITAKRPAPSGRAHGLEAAYGLEDDADSGEFAVSLGGHKPSADDVVAGLNSRGLTPVSTYDDYVNKVLVKGKVFGHDVTLHPDFLAKLQRAETAFKAGGGSVAKIAPSSDLRDARKGKKSLSFHAWGLAVDLNGATNPYIMHEDGEIDLDAQVGPVYDRIAQILLGRNSVIPNDITRGDSSRARTSKLYDSLSQESNVFHHYFSFINASDAALSDVIASAVERSANWKNIMGLSGPPSPTQLRQRMMDDWVILNGGKGPEVTGLTYHQPAKVEGDRPLARTSPPHGFLAHPKDLVLALWDQGLAWGAIDFGKASGDVMHFDDPWSRIGQGILAIRGMGRPKRV